MDNITNLIDYYSVKSNQLLNFINQNDTLSIDQIIEYGKELEILEYKLTALEIAYLEENKK